MIDFQFWLGELTRVIRRKEFLQAAEVSFRMIKEIEAQEARPTILLPTEKKGALGNARASLERLASDSTAKNYPEINNALASVREALDYLYANTVVYFLRHPQRATQAGRALSSFGVRQARQYALALIDEILLCPKNVSVYVYTSDAERTKKFAQIVGYELTKLGQLQGRTVHFTLCGQDPALTYGFTAEEEEFLNQAALKKGIAPDGDFPQFMDWIQNAADYAKQFPQLHRPEAIFAELQGFVSRGVSQFPSTDAQWNVVLGFSHGWILDVFRLYYAGADVKSIIPTADIIKIDAQQAYIDDKWYPYK